MVHNRYGIEIELERVNASRVRPSRISNWIMEGDGSLRNGGMEFKSSQDWDLDTIVASVDSLQEELTRIPTVEASHRCGIHIHMDVRDMSHEGVYNLLCNYARIEPSFFSYVNTFGNSREGSHFCVPYYHIRNRAAGFLRGFKDYDLGMVRTFGRKYTALNVLPFLNFGSVEWRHFPAVLPITVIKEWLAILDSFKEEGRKGIMSDDRLLEWLNEWMPDHVNEDLIDKGQETYLFHLLQENAEVETQEMEADMAAMRRQQRTQRRPEEETNPMAAPDIPEWLTNITTGPHTTTTEHMFVTPTRDVARPESAQRRSVREGWRMEDLIVVPFAMRIHYRRNFPDLVAENEEAWHALSAAQQDSYFNWRAARLVETEAARRAAANDDINFGEDEEGPDDNF